MTGADTPGGLVITGASRGIGAATALLAAERGYRVCVNYARDAAAARHTVDAITCGGGTAVAVQADVSVPADVQRLFEQADAAIGPIRALVNNAGVTGRIAPFVDTDIATARRVYEVNVIGSMLCAQQALARFIPHRRGVIVNLSSIAASTGAAGEYTHYAASKAAIQAWTRGLAREVAESGIRVVAVAPGSTLTDIHSTAGEPNRPERVRTNIPMGRLAAPTEIAEAVIWLLSDAASYVTGSTLSVTGGT